MLFSTFDRVFIKILGALAAICFIPKATGKIQSNFSLDSSYFEQQTVSLYLQAESHLSKAEFSAAVRKLKKASKYDSSLKLKARLCETYSQASLIGEAVACFEDIVSKNSDPSIRFRLAQIYKNHGFSHESLKNYEILTLQGKEKSQLESLALKINLNKHQPALNQIKKMKQAAWLNQNLIIHLKTLEAYIYYKETQFGKSKEILTDLKSLKPQKLDQVLKLTQLFIKHGLSKDALQVLLNVVKTESKEHVLFLHTLADLFKHLKDHKSYYQTLEKLAYKRALTLERGLDLQMHFFSAKQTEKFLTLTEMLKDKFPDQMSKYQIRFENMKKDLRASSEILPTDRS